MHGQSIFPALFLGLFLGWLSLSLGAPVRVQEIDPYPGAVPNRTNTTSTVAPAPKFTRPANETKNTDEPADAAAPEPAANAAPDSAKSAGSTPADDANTDDATNADADAANTDDATNADADAAADPAAADAAPDSANRTADSTADDTTNTDADDADGHADADPCAKQMCTPLIDTQASVVESYKRHRAQVALIGDFGTCLSGPGTGKHLDDNSTAYTWTVDWGDDESYELKKKTIGPYQAEHIYAKKGKYTVEATFCHHVDSCDSGCTTYAKTIKVKP